MAQPAADQSASPDQLHEVVAAIRHAIGRVIVGQHSLVDRLLVALLTNNHALIEGVPGLAKTLTVQTLSQVLHTSFSRVQFTPDLLPADITGTLIFNPHDGDFAVRRGPIFVNIVLADEINRAPAKVQSALLEAMQERQVSIGGETHALPDPFMVLATQNSIEQEGTYPLPGAQLDRFMLKILVDYPSREDERVILAQALDDALPSIQPVAGPVEIAALRSAVRAVDVNESLREYILRLVESTRDPARYQLDGLVPLIEFGASPRAATFLARGVQALAFVRGRDYSTPDDVKELAPDILRHRLVLSYEAEAQGVSAEKLVSRLLEGVGIP